MARDAAAASPDADGPAAVAVVRADNNSVSNISNIVGKIAKAARAAKQKNSSAVRRRKRRRKRGEASRASARKRFRGKLRKRFRGKRGKGSRRGKGSKRGKGSIGKLKNASAGDNISANRSVTIANASANRTFPGWQNDTAAARTASSRARASGANLTDDRSAAASDSENKSADSEKQTLRDSVAGAAPNESVPNSSSSAPDSGAANATTNRSANETDSNGTMDANSTKTPPPPTGKFVMNGVQNLSEYDRVLQEQSLAFAWEMIKAERQEKCPEKNPEVKFSLISGSVQVSAQITVTMKVDVVGGTTHTMKVGWVPSPRRLTAKQRNSMSRSMDDESGSGTKGLMDAGAKLMLPALACELDSGGANDLLVGEATLDDEGLPVGFRDRALESPPQAFGLIVEEELRAYRAGLLQASEGRSRHTGSRWQKTVKYAVLNDGTTMTTTYPATLDWRELKPSCFDYVHSQGDCGACYVFAAVDSLSDRHCINEDNESNLGKKDHLSIQQTILCEPLGRQCAGGWAEIAFNHSMVVGIGTEASWGYERSCLSDSECAFGSQCMKAPRITYQCSTFFSSSELNDIQTMDDAYKVVAARCQNSAAQDGCMMWAKRRFRRGSSELFATSKRYCDSLVKEFAEYNQTAMLLLEQAMVKRGGQSKFEGGLLQGASRALEQTASGKSWWPWSDSHKKSNKSAAGEAGGSSDAGGSDSKEANNADSEAANDGPSPLDGNDNSGGTTLEKTEATYNCDRDRCTTAASPHYTHDFHYLYNYKSSFKYELYNFGPFYTSFYVYEDLTWFFENFPNDGYNHQWGGQLGGHAVAIIGWEGNCEYHSGDSLLQATRGRRVEVPPDGPGRLPPPPRPRTDEGERTGAALLETEVSADMSYQQLYRTATMSNRRRTAKGECWLLRNSWGDDWADSGYFRMKDDMLTCDDAHTCAESYNLHIASAAGDQTYSK